VLQELKTLVAPEMLLAWHRKLIAGNMMAASGVALDVLARRLTSKSW
jgi:hypothetical protein